MLEVLEDRTTPAHLNYYGGPLLANVQIEPIYLKDSQSGNTSPYQAQLDGFFQEIAYGPYIPTLLGEYGVPANFNGHTNPAYTIGNGSVGANDLNVSVTRHPYIEDADIQVLISQEIDAHRTAPVSANTLYVVVTPPGDQVHMGGALSGVIFCAYHYTYVKNGQNVAYAVIPHAPDMDPGCGPGTDFQNETSYISHEVAESITDSAVGLATAFAPPLGWYDPVGSDGEIGDIANQLEFALEGWTFQEMFSNAHNANVAVPDPVAMDHDFSAATGTNLFVLRENGSNLELYHNGTRIASQPLGHITEVSIKGPANQDNTMVIDYSAGVFNVPVTFDGGAGAGNHRLIVDDSGDPIARTVSAGNGSVTGLGGPIHYNTADLGGLTVLGGSGGNTFTISGALPASTDFDGGTGNNTLVGPGGAVTWTVSGANQGSVAGVSFTDFADLRSSAGPNRFVIQPGGSEARIDGGAATNTLDFSAFPSPVSVPLPGPGSSHGLQGAAAPWVSFFDNIDSFVNAHLATLTATGVNVSATAGAPFSGTVATFSNPLPFGGAASYTAVIAWGDGSTSAGVISGSGSTLTVTGSHTYADPVNQTVHVAISHKLGYTTTATTTANVTSQGQGVQAGLAGGTGFWHSGNGQALINSFNGGSTATALSAWLAASFPNLYGAAAGGNDLTSRSNAQVAAFYLTQFALTGPKVEAQVLAAALNVYATTLSLGGTAGQAYGFTVSAAGLGARSFNVGADGAAFGVVNNTTRNVYQLLAVVNQKAVGGVLYNGDATGRQEAADLFDALSQAGAI
jgi:hypothetical protein